MKRGKDACDTPRLNARRFEEMVVGKIRSNVLTEGNIRALVKVVDEQMDGVAREQRKRLETLEDVKRKLGRIWHFVETTDIDMADASDRIKEHRERQERLEAAAADARASSPSAWWGLLKHESTDHFEGIAPVPLGVRPEPRRPGCDYRSPIIADGLQWPDCLPEWRVFYNLAHD